MSSVKNLMAFPKCWFVKTENDVSRSNSREGDERNIVRERKKL